MGAYGKRCSAEYESQGRIVHFKSIAERCRADVLEMCWRGGLVLDWAYEPQKFFLKRKRGETEDEWTPDFRVNWKDEGVTWEEVKGGNLKQKYRVKMQRFCVQYPNERLRLVWYGSPPKKGPRKKELDILRQGNLLYDLQFVRLK
jgi:hypothetical protein